MKNQTGLKHIALVLALACGILVQSPLYASNVAVGRYLSVSLKPVASQVNLLHQHIEVIFPQGITTISEAMQFILRFSGFKLINKKLASIPVKHLLTESLPEVDRHFGPMRLEQGLLTLAGEPFILLIAPVHRIIGLKLKPRYRMLYHTTYHSDYRHHHKKNKGNLKS